MPYYQKVSQGLLGDSWRVSCFLEDKETDHSVSFIHLSNYFAEYRAMATATSDLIWIKSFLASMRVFLHQLIQLFCDNQTTSHIVKNPMFHKRTKHTDIDCHFVRERLLSWELITRYVLTKHQLADIFTTALGKQEFHFLLSKLGIANPHAPPWGRVIRKDMVDHFFGYIFFIFCLIRKDIVDNVFGYIFFLGWVFV